VDSKEGKPDKGSEDDFDSEAISAEVSSDDVEGDSPVGPTGDGVKPGRAMTVNEFIESRPGFGEFMRGAASLNQQVNSVIAVLGNSFSRSALELAKFLDTPAYRNLFDINPEIWKSIRNRNEYNAQDERVFHSPGFNGPESYYSVTEVVVDSFEDLAKGIQDLAKKHPEMPLVWRGVRSSNWGFHSSLFRILCEKKGVKAPSESSDPQPYPTEEEMVEAEVELLGQARSMWRYDHMSALEIFARVQHVGGPTRLIDVTRNPYIGAWFAVEKDSKTDEEDARLFALATHPVSGASQHTVELDGVGASRTPFWHEIERAEAKQLMAWGAGSLRRVWFPPVYDTRILAQNAGFVFDGVPIPTKASYFTKEKGVYFTKGDLLSAGSIYMKMYQHGRKIPPNALGFSPSFSFRITARAKEDIRKTLETRFGYRSSSIYPDAQGLSSFMNKRILSGDF
jgi:hypothetical protein